MNIAVEANHPETVFSPLLLILFVFGEFPRWAKSCPGFHPGSHGPSPKTQNEYTTRFPIFYMAFKKYNRLNL